MVIFLQRTFTLLVHAHAGRTLSHGTDIGQESSTWQMLAVPIAWIPAFELE